MARRKEGHEVLFVELPEELKERLRLVAKRNKRSMVGETVVAIERHVVAEEVVPSAEPTTAKGRKGGAK